MNLKKLTPLILSLILVACNNNPKTNTSKETTTPFQNKGHILVAKMVNHVGSYKLLLNKKNVVYTYTYQTPDGKTDISTEKYIFKNELSMGSYKQHQRTFPDLTGKIQQGYDGLNY